MTTASRRTTPRKPKAKIVDGFLAELAAGCYDADLDRIVEGLSNRLREAMPRFCWKLTYAGTTWTEETVTAGERALVEQLLSRSTGRPFSYLDLDPRKFIGHAIALIVAHLHAIDGLSIEDAVVEVEALPEPEWQKVIDVYQWKTSVPTA